MLNGRIPEGDILKEKEFILHVNAIKESGDYPHVSIDSVYWAMMDWKVKHIPIMESCSRNHIAYQTILDLKNDEFILYPD